ncbi:MAG: dihydropteroate synthase [Dehalococcoidia bacterium]|nr:dihydropteroate synthase [Dehalococcoidia bacterium]
MAETRVSSASREAIIGRDRPTLLIGERINPAGKKTLAEALKAGNLAPVRQAALSQVSAGADILDVNVGTFGVDEVALLPRAVGEILKAVEIPLCLDSNRPQALEAALAVTPGKPIINSVTGEERSLATVLPLVREYGTAVIGLVQDDNGIPDSPEERVAIARKIVDRAVEMGIPREDVIIDCLASSLGANTSSGAITLRTIQGVRSELGLNITLGASNISFGLPDRELLNSAFATAAIVTGATCLIANVSCVRPFVLAADLILGRDRRARRYIEAYRARRQPQAV